MYFLALDGVTWCQLMSLYSICKLTMMNVCIEWRIVTQSAMTVNARLHKCHTRITPELYTECSVAPFRLRLLLHPPRHSPLVLSQSFIYQPQPHSTFSYINRPPQIHKQRGITFTIGTTRKFPLQNWIEPGNQCWLNLSFFSSFLLYRPLNRNSIPFTLPSDRHSIDLRILSSNISRSRSLCRPINVLHTINLSINHIIQYGITHTDTLLYLLQSPSSRIESINKDGIHFVSFRLE